MYNSRRKGLTVPWFSKPPAVLVAAHQPHSLCLGSQGKKSPEWLAGAGVEFFSVFIGFFRFFSGF